MTKPDPTPDDLALGEAIVAVCDVCDQQALMCDCPDRSGT